ncbi:MULTISPECIES: FMN-dependent NADH-azoreductase [unclassified Halomonas]|uniref:FMN-dependent NADH-azoreductase n=1 Tax=unclassified Halomonas TaxID=2609666 RepID=UPI0021E4DAB7|nr:MULTISPECIES: NAD(P)H-dependent oxidoreductase [unclassified Halomonas]UYG00856.1 NAD(P)H-dependent oxidoreductase [Halomonas sp. GD1P12]WNL38081.1 NAD(P)H-dependent oxidoreductase [Halomonas sp. PAMB 3232]
MRTLLHLDASVRTVSNPVPSHDSISKKIARAFIDAWQSVAPGDEIIHRDVGVAPPAFIDQAWIGAVFTPEASRSEEQHRHLALSDQMIDELTRSDIVVLSSPMYNYGMPAPLKAWFDQVIRINKTFSFDLARGDAPLAPILSGKTLVLLTSSGEFGFGKGGVREHMNHLGPHIKTLSHYLGVETFHEIGAEYQEFNDERHRQSLARAFDEAKALATRLSVER